MWLSYAFSIAQSFMMFNARRGQGGAFVGTCGKVCLAMEITGQERERPETIMRGGRAGMWQPAVNCPRVWISASGNRVPALRMPACAA